MKLTEDAKGALKKNGTLINVLASQLEVKERTVEYHISTNRENGIMTTRKVLDIIFQETGLTEEQILTEEKAN